MIRLYGLCIINIVILTTSLLTVQLFLCTTALSAEHTSKQIIHVPYVTLDNSKADYPYSFDLVVRNAGEADTAMIEKLRGRTWTILGSSLGISTISVVEAFAIPGFFSGTLIAGAVILVPLSITIAAMEHHVFNTIERALQETSLTELTQENLSNYLPSFPFEGERATVELIIIGFGLTENPSCIFTDAVIKVSFKDKTYYEDIIYIEPYLRSEDAPPPICRPLDTFAQKNGKLLKQGLIEYSQVLSAILRKRTKALPWLD